MAKRVVLAYSGGLDTSVILKVLVQQGCEVIACIVDVGQNEDFEQIAERAEKVGASKIIVRDLQHDLLTEFVFPALASNAVYENRYLLGTALARPLIARCQVEVALDEGATTLAHGATGKGNDQVRFELAYAALAPQLEVIAPWKDRGFLNRFKGRSDLLRYAKEEQIPVDATLEKPFSIDENLLHTSHEAGILEDPMHCPDGNVFSRTVDPEDAPEQAQHIELRFKDAVPVQLFIEEGGITRDEPLDLFRSLNDLGRRHGIGRVDIVENRFVGIKSRGVYETPGGTILHHALRDLEGIAMDREVQHLRDMLAPRYAELIYNGFWYSPEADFLRAAFTQSQRLIDGRVRLRLYKGNVIVEGRESPSSLYNRELASMDVEGGYDQADAAGFIALNALRLRAHKVIIRGPGTL